MDQNLKIEFSETNGGKEQEILKYEDLHKHLEKECDVSISITKHRIKKEIRNQSKYLVKFLKRNENFMIFKNFNINIFQSPFQAKLFIQYNINIFADDTFKIAPKRGYNFYTTSFSILKNKEQRIYEVLFEETKKNAEKNNKVIITPKIFIVILKKSIEIKEKKIDYVIKKGTDEINALIKYYKNMEMPLKKKKEKEMNSLSYG
ncbi:hypothetical protein H8356DRAFT_1394407 [Neocallimastix lanati (nom. inval.)]|nr:hypothetical protein H8356DRAFT_1394407 [Neocallimastix sp. JGI-2020a]